MKTRADLIRTMEDYSGIHAVGDYDYDVEWRSLLADAALGAAVRMFVKDLATSNIRSYGDRNCGYWGRKVFYAIADALGAEQKEAAKQ